MPLQPGAVRRFGCRGVNAYLVDDEGAVTLVDAGTPWDASRLREMLSRSGIAAADIDRVLLTHYDLDHVGTLGALDLAPDTPIYAAEPGASYLLGDADPPGTNHKGAFQRLLRPLLSTPTNEVRRVSDGDSVGGFVAHRTPGHTPGHVVYHHAGHGAAFLGDVVREDDGALVPLPWFMCYDVDRNRTSVAELAERIDPFEVACVGHGDPLRTGGYEALRRVAERV